MNQILFKKTLLFIDLYSKTYEFLQMKNMENFLDSHRIFDFLVE